MKLTAIAAIAAIWSVWSPQAIAATIAGEFFDAATPIETIADADAFIAANAPTATFESTGVDYPQGAVDTVNNTSTLADFLGTDAASLSGAGDSLLDQSVFRFTGFVDLAPGANTFTVASDDGFRLTIGNLVLEFGAERTFAETTVTSDIGDGLTAFELIFFENTDVLGIEFLIDGVVAAPADPPAVIPTPGGLPLALTGVAMLGVAMLRRRRA